MRQVWRMLLRNPGGMIGVAILTIAIAVALFGPLLFPTSPWRMVQRPFLPPFTLANLPLGTDALGRDVMAGIIYGARVSLLVGLISTLASLAVGIPLGAAAGYFGGKIDDALMRFTEFFQTVPSFALAIVLVAIMQPSIVSIVVAIAIVSWPPVARLVRGEVLSLRTREYVQAAVVTLAGVHSGTLIGGAVLTETVFAWPGIGRLMYEALLQRDYNLLLGVFVVCSAMVLAFNLITDLVYRSVDPRIEFAS